MMEDERPISPMAPSHTALALDFDGSARGLAAVPVVELGAWQEAVRFACSTRTLRRLGRHLDEAMPAQHGTVLLGSGDFHHLSALLIERAARLHGQTPFRVVVLDNHPDNMRLPWGIHCGSWVARVARLPAVSHVHVLGITSRDIALRHAWENRLRPLLRGKLTYWSMDVNVDWAHKMGLGWAFRRFDSPDALVSTFIAECCQRPVPTYLSIDKDVLSTEVVRTNWDQGRMLERHVVDVIVAVKDGLLGSDITGEISLWKYITGWKRLLSALDGQDTAMVPSQLAAWQHAQQQLNVRLLRVLGHRL